MPKVPCCCYKHISALVTVPCTIVLTDEVLANRACSLHAMLRLVSATAGRKLLLNVASFGSKPVEHELRKQT